MRSMGAMGQWVLVAPLVAGLAAAAVADPAGEALVVPAFTAYVEPDPNGLPVSGRGISDWTDAKSEVVWHGKINTPGKLQVAVALRLPAGQSASLRMTVAGKALDAKVAGKGEDAVTADFGAVEIPAAGYYAFSLEGIEKEGRTFGDLDSLRLSGPAAAGAHFNLKPRRNAASVHLIYPTEKGAPIEWFYNEVTVRTDPLWTYYMACGFSRGYFGIQVNSPTERRIIFSVWDSGNEGVDRSKVKPEDMVRCLAKGEGVFAGGFGNEGTGGHSHLVYPWVKDKTYRFLVHAKPVGTATVYTGYFYFPEKKQWGLIARFRAPKDGGYLRGLYSFNENFGGANGDLRRLAEFGSQWVRTADGKWTELRTARFSHDGTGKADRLDHGAGVVDGRFFLSNGGFVADGVKFGDTFTRPATAGPPTDLPAE